MNNPQMLEYALKDKEVRKSLYPEAQKRAHNTLLLMEIAKVEKIVISDDDIEAKRKAGEQETSLSRQAKEDLRESLLFEKAINVILSSCSWKTTQSPNLGS